MENDTIYSEEDTLLKTIFYRVSTEIDDIDYVYHYTDTDTVKLIMNDDRVCFRMTRIEDFPDKSEGKVIAEFYNNALSELLADGKISETVKRELENPDISEYTMSGFFEGNNSCVGRRTINNIYVACFSTKPDDKRMQNEYIKNVLKKGYCIRVLVSDLCEETNRFCFINGQNFNVEKVLYGKDCIDELKKYILMLIGERKKLNDTLSYDDIKNYINSFLEEVRCLSKQEEYRCENEVRLILSMPVGGNLPKDYSPQYIEAEQNGKRFVTVSLSKHIIFGIKKSASVTENEDKELRRVIRERGYSNI